MIIFIRNYFDTDSVLGYMGIIQVILTFGSFYLFTEIAKLKLTRARPWITFAAAFLLATYRRVYNYSTIKNNLRNGVISNLFFVRVMIPFVTSILIFLALIEIYRDFKKNYKQPSDKKYEEIIHEENS